MRKLTELFTSLREKIKPRIIENKDGFRFKAGDWVVVTLQHSQEKDYSLPYDVQEEMNAQGDLLEMKPNDDRILNHWKDLNKDIGPPEFSQYCVKVVQTNPTTNGGDYGDFGRFVNIEDGLGNQIINVSINSISGPTPNTPLSEYDDQVPKELLSHHQELGANPFPI